MKDIDFLPAELLRQRSIRAQMWWQVSGYLAIFAAVMFSAAWQNYLRAQLVAQLTMMESVCQQAREQQLRLDKLQVDARDCEQTAALYAFLDHPWPRTQILADLASNLPESVLLTQIKLQRQNEVANSQNVVRVTQASSAEATLSPLQAIKRDLESLQKEALERPVIVEVTGTTDDPAALQTWLSQFATSSLYESAKLTSLNSSDESTRKGLRFTLQLQLKREHGLPTATRASENTAALVVDGGRT